MDLASLRSRLRHVVGLDLDARWLDWCRTGPAEDDAEAFLAWLLQAGHIDASAFLAAHAAEAVHTIDLGGTWGDEPAESGVQPDERPPERPPGPPPARYTPLATVGRGGMSSIWVARDGELGRKVAYKVLTPEAGRRPALFSRFLTEVQVTAQLEHPNIVPIYGLERELGRPHAYAMKLVHGETLGEVIARSSAQRAGAGRVDDTLGLDALLEVFLKVCDAMAYAHGKGVVHRDLKPANIMVGRHGEVYVMDWGLAKVVHESAGTGQTRVDLAGDAGGAHLTRVGSVLGTPAYMAPEQARGETSRVGPHSDVYALGLILFEIVCGRPAREAASGAEMLAVAAAGEVGPIRAPDGGAVPRELAGILHKVLSADGLARYPSVVALAEDLRRFRANEAVSAAPDSALQAAQRWLSRHRRATSALLVGLVASSVVLFATGAAGVVWKSSRDAVIAHERQARLTRLLADVNRLGSDIDRHFSSVESRVEAVAAASRALLIHGAPAPDERWYRTATDFVDASTGPPDVAFSIAYQGNLSTHFPDVSVVPGADPAQAERLIRTVHPIRHELRRGQLAMRQATADPPLSEAAADAAWRAETGPIRWLSVALSEGILIEMPGMKWDPTGYDPRVRPWYALGQGARLPRWGNPYQESGMTKLQMPCSVGIFDADDRQVGVATASTGFDWLLARHLNAPVAGLRERFLLDREGRILIRSTEASELAPNAEAWDAVHGGRRYGRAGVLASIGAQASGHLEVDGLIVVHQALHVPGWRLVVEAGP